MKLSPQQCVLESAGHFFRHVVVTLRGDQTIAELREQPSAWALCQSNRNICLKRADTVTCLSADGKIKVESMTVVRAVGPDVFLGAPLRIVEMETDVAFEDSAGHEVIPSGVGYAIKHTKGGKVEDRIYATAAAAKTELNRRAPVQV